MVGIEGFMVLIGFVKNVDLESIFLGLNWKSCELIYATN